MDRKFRICVGSTKITLGVASVDEIFFVFHKFEMRLSQIRKFGIGLFEYIWLV